MTTAATIIVIISALLLIGVGILMLVRPRTARHFLRKAASTYLINYTELGLRAVWGLALIFLSDSSKFPTLLRIFSYFIIFSAVVLMLTPRKWHAKYAVFWADRLSPAVIRALFPVSIVFGLLLIYIIF